MILKYLQCVKKISNRKLGGFIRSVNSRNNCMNSIIEEKTLFELIMFQVQTETRNSSNIKKKDMSASKANAVVRSTRAVVAGL